jgi:hypothetical protein
MFFFFFLSIVYMNNAQTEGIAAALCTLCSAISIATACALLLTLLLLLLLLTLLCILPGNARHRAEE